MLQNSKVYHNLHHSLHFIISEIGKVRGNLFQINGKKNEPLVLPDAAGPNITLSEKVYVPIKEFPDVSTHTSYCHLKSLPEPLLLCNIMQHNI